MLRSYSAKTAEVRGQLVPEALLFQKLQEEDFALVDTSLSDSCIFASPGLWGSKENIRSFTEAAAQCMYDSGLDTDAGAYIVIFYKLDLKDWPGRRISLKSDYFKCLQGNSDVLFRILPDAAFEQAPYITWVSSLDSILRKASLLNKIAKSGQMVASDTVSLAIATIKLTETQLSQVTTSADVKVVQRTFLFLSAYGVSLSELIGAKHKDYTKLSVTLFLLATKWAIFSYKKHRILSLPNMKSAASQALDFVLAMSSDSKLLDLLSEEEYISFSGSASMCLGNIIAPDAIFPSPDTTSSEPMLKHAFISNKVPRQQRVRAEIERLDDSRSVHGTSGRVLDSSLNTMDRNLARLSSEAPKARVKWQRGRFINKGAMGSVSFAVAYFDMIYFNGVTSFPGVSRIQFRHGNIYGRQRDLLQRGKRSGATSSK